MKEYDFLSKAKLYKIRLVSNMPNLFGDSEYSDEWNLLEKALEDDLHQVNPFVFKHPNNKQKSYYRCHFACPANGNSLLVLGQFRDPMDFAYVFVVLHSRFYKYPYIVIERYPMITSNPDKLAEMVEKALNWVLKGTDVNVTLEATDMDLSDDLYLIDSWRSWNIQLYKNGGRNLIRGGYENSLLRYKESEAEKNTCKSKKKTLKSVRIEDYISKKVLQPDRLLAWLDSELEGKKTPRDIMRPIRLLIDKKWLNRPTYESIDKRYHIKELISLSSFNHYTNADHECFNFDDAYQEMKNTIEIL